jgi:hypothetical protein
MWQPGKKTMNNTNLTLKQNAAVGRLPTAIAKSTQECKKDDEVMKKTLRFWLPENLKAFELP